MAYRSIINTQVKNNSHTMAIDFIQKYGSNKQLKILDLGCSEGYFGEYLKSLGHHVSGVESNANAAIIAVRVLDYLFKGTIEEFFRTHPHHLFDVIVLGDVLEHLLEPKLTLEITSNHLTEDGFIVVSLPNITHGAIRAMLLEGRWQYSDLGILDKTHLHFYSKESAQLLLEEAHFKIEEINQVTLPIDIVNKICNLNLKPESISTITELCSADSDLNVFQNVYIAKPSNESSLRIVTYSNDEGGVFEIRLKKPLKNWSQRYQGSVRHRSINDIYLSDLFWGDIFIFQRVAGHSQLNLIRLLQRYGKRIIFEIDDLLNDLPEFLAHHRMDKAALKTLNKTIAQADLVTTTTLRIAKEFIKLNPSVAIIPNCSDSPELIANHDINENKITLVIASSDKVLVHYLVQPLLRLQTECPGKFYTVIIGPIGDYLAKHGIIAEQYPIIKNSQFHAFLSKLINPIGLIPLDDSKFSSCKSPIKFIDYALAGVPSICSNVPPYSDVINHQKTGILVENDNESWANEILRLSADIELRKVLVNNAVDYLKSNNRLDHAADAWDHAFRKLKTQRVIRRDLLESKTYEKLNTNVSSSSNGLKLYFNPQIGRLLMMALSPRFIKKALSLYQREGLKSVLNKIRTL